ncbi:UsfY protein [Mycobacteroides abscessus subsp. abscessus]|uniref:protein UsfY n=1 Tax=Mycobacteroides abscessus TaxID=36809 RepID=UPI00092CCC24|nr:protein UsfY [Mycobacteroides abscessus]SHR91068.1 UsfY protein [Mycobacteroides abscessus subsp. abscessus]
MHDDGIDPVDHARTFRPHAGESLKDRVAWPGLAFIALGVLSVVLGLAAAAYMFYGWTLVASIAALVFFFLGWLWMHVERRRVRRMEAEWHQEHSVPHHD